MVSERTTTADIARAYGCHGETALRLRRATKAGPVNDLFARAVLELGPIRVWWREGEYLTLDGKLVAEVAVIKTYVDMQMARRDQQQ